jgi:hypothetical protein
LSYCFVIHFIPLTVRSLCRVRVMVGVGVRVRVIHFISLAVMSLYKMDRGYS